MFEGKEVIVEPNVNESDISSFIGGAITLGVKKFVCEPVEGVDAEFIQPVDIPEKNVGGLVVRKKIVDKADLEEVIYAARSGAKAVLVEASDWKIIPLENLIAEIQSSGCKIYAYASSPTEVRPLLGVLDRGADGVVLKTSSLDAVKQTLDYLKVVASVNLVAVDVLEVREAGMGERVCVDTSSMLCLGEGLLVGSRSNFLFLVHNESLGSKFTSPRPFRVNAGSVSSYILTPNGKTKYLSELEAGDEVLVVSAKDVPKVATVGRVKIERRPLILVKAAFGEEVGSILLQNAETIALVGEGEKIIPVTEVKRGDRILASVVEAKGRHFGSAVDEYILEK
ncbi:MAG: 3-dehydroquinate synthase II [Nitrososphaerales archaeon]